MAKQSAWCRKELLDINLTARLNEIAFRGSIAQRRVAIRAAIAAGYRTEVSSPPSREKKRGK